ncbi:hypothetical protein [Flavihumibacter sp. ZG627]|uniref:hypothetical protein n=1 Tax=Flavihumibacter sp. ZG627 TaxID=1463156 RepID=UPI00057E1722|nr:hypothetical protein [Flavihumibacter sp. ZG627]KIC89141.1 hypothetical protein HY58_18480 [Flavihumibacter sp. ZG627]
MRKIDANHISHNKSRNKYQNKRQTYKWKKRKKNNLLFRKEARILAKTQFTKEFVNLPAPKDYSFIRNTNEVLKYFDDAKQVFKKGGNVRFDISEIEKLTPDAIALHVSSINHGKTVQGCYISGNYPIDPELNKLFTQSGFQRFVHTTGKKVKTHGNFLHRERHYKVEPLIARNAAIAGIKHTFGTINPFEPLYDILIECMSNTNNHATLSSTDKTYWWLYVYNDPNSTITSYSFLDLGVGIFESIELQTYFQNFVKNYFKGVLHKHINLVEDLLAGKIQSRVDEDNEIRGKGIPQIVEHSKLNVFKEFYIISNDVKINVKTGEKEELQYDFHGTFLYWEIQNN